MGKLFKIEMKKLRKSTAMKVMLIVALVLSAMNIGVYALVSVVDQPELSAMLPSNGYSVAVTLTQDTSDIVLMVVVLMAILIGGDFSTRTLQTQVSAGFSRAKILASRYMSTIVAYLILYLLYFGVTVGGMCAIFGYGEHVTSEMTSDLILQFGLGIIMTITMLAFYMFFAFLFKSTGATIGVCVPFMLFGVSIIQIIAMISDVIYDIFLFTPFGQSVDLMLNGISELNVLFYILVCVVWFFGFYGVTYFMFKKSELK